MLLLFVCVDVGATISMPVAAVAVTFVDIAATADVTADLIFCWYRN